MNSLHPSHKTRMSFDSSTYDEICINCGATDHSIGGWGKLAEPCPCVSEEETMPKVTDEEASEIQENIDRAKPPEVGSANDRQVAGNHYQSEIQHWDYVVANDIPYLEAQVIKYLTRWRKKNGIEDVYKAQHYLQKLIEVEEAKFKVKEIE